MGGIVVIGAGQAAASFAAKFRALDAETSVTILGEEPVIPYQRPPLSKKYATGEMALPQLFLRPEEWYSDNDVTLRTEAKVTGIDREAKTVTLKGNETLNWTKLVFATGARVRTLPEAVTQGLSGIHYLRSLADADLIAPELTEGRRVLIVGGGYIGLEAAAVCASKGLEVTVVEAAERILQRVACQETSDWFRALHQAEGVTFHEGAGLGSFDGEDGTLTGATLSDGRHIPTDFALIGIGVIPNAELAAEVGLEVDGGIVVNETCQTSDPDIYAAGDCAIFPYQGQQTRLESVPNAIDQAAAAAQNIAGEVAPYVAKPWFWSDQYDVKLQIAGLNRGFDQIVTRPGDKDRSVAHFYYGDGRLLAIDAMNEPRVYMVGKRLLEAGKSIDPVHAADPGFDLKALLK